MCDIIKMSNTTNSTNAWKSLFNRLLKDRSGDKYLVTVLKSSNANKYILINMIKHRINENHIFKMLPLDEPTFNIDANTREISVPDVCASFQDEAVGQVVSKSIFALKEFGYDKIALAGGVSANLCLRQKMDEEASKIGAKVFYPPIKLCTDNAAMIACAGYYNFINNKSIVDPKTLVPTSNIAL